ncbi:MAG: ABC transporter permease [Pseudomonadota bacterium]
MSGNLQGSSGSALARVLSGARLTIGVLAGLALGAVFGLLSLFSRRGPRRPMDPLTERRWRAFKANRRGYVSLWIFAVLFGLSLIAELIANDKPLLIWHDGALMSPMVATYTRDNFGDEFEEPVDYRDHEVQCLIVSDGAESCIFAFDDVHSQYREAQACVEGGGARETCLGGFESAEALRAAVRACLVNTAGNAACSGAPLETLAENRVGSGWMVWPLIPWSHDTINKDASPLPGAPSAENWLGTDNRGRDLLALTIYGFRISVAFGLIVTLFSSVVGVFAGAAQGFFGGSVDLFFQRFIEVWVAVPTLYVIIIVSSVFPPNFWLLAGLLILFGWTTLVGVVRAEFLRARNFEYVQAARALGVGDWTIMFRHLLPNAMVATLTLLPFVLTGSIGALATLDFLGFGLAESYPSLGEIGLQAKDNLDAPWMILTAFFTFAIMLSLLVFIFEAVRDAFDPRKTLT